jgi:hypothetical protein
MLPGCRVPCRRVPTPSRRQLCVVSTLSPPTRAYCESACDEHANWAHAQMRVLWEVISIQAEDRALICSENVLYGAFCAVMLTFACCTLESNGEFQSVHS